MMQSNLYYSELEALQAFVSLPKMTVAKLFMLEFDHDNKVTKRAKVLQDAQHFEGVADL
jgi:hypothetical protein